MIFSSIGLILFLICTIFSCTYFYVDDSGSVLMIIGITLVSLTIAQIAKSGFNAMTKNSESEKGINSVVPLLLGLVEPFSLVIAGMLLFKNIHGNYIVMGLALNAIPIGILGTSWIENVSKNPDNNTKVIGYGAFGCIEIASIVLMKKLFESDCSLFALCAGIGLTVINAGVISYELCTSIGRNPTIKNQLLVLALPLLGAIDVTGLVLIMKLILTYMAKI